MSSRNPNSADNYLNLSLTGLQLTQARTSPQNGAKQQAPSSNRSKTSVASALAANNTNRTATSSARRNSLTNGIGQNLNNTSHLENSKQIKASGQQLSMTTKINRPPSTPLSHHATSNNSSRPPSAAKLYLNHTINANRMNNAANGAQAAPGNTAANESDRSKSDKENSVFKQISNRSDDDDFDGENLFETLKNKHAVEDAPNSSRNANKRDNFELFLNNLASVDKSVENKEAVMRSFLESRNLEPYNEDFQFKDSLDFKLINPLKDEKIAKLQTANENLRRELGMNSIEITSVVSSSKPSVSENKFFLESKPAGSTEQQRASAQKQQVPVRAKNINEMMNEYNTLQRIKKNVAATKIQTWYRRRLMHKKNEAYRSQLTKMLSEKRNELKKSLLDGTSLSKTSNSVNMGPRFRKNNRGKTDASMALQPSNDENVTSVAPALTASNDIKPAPEQLPLKSPHLVFNTANASRLVDSEQETKPVSPREEIKPKKAREMKPSLTEGQISSLNASVKPTTTTTVESLLMSLEKIDKESELLLNPEINTNEQPRHLVNDTENINSIISYLKEAEQAALSTPVVPVSKILSSKKSVDGAKPSLPPPTPRKDGAANKSAVAKPQWSSNTDMRKSSSSSNLAGSKKPKSPAQDEVDANAEIEKMNKLSSQTASEITSNILTLHLELEEKKRTIVMLEKALNQQRELTIRHTQEADKEMQVRMEAQKCDYEAAIQRHLTFIDQLIDDKKGLAEKCEKLVKELKEIEKSYSEKLKTTEEKSKFEMQKLKETLETAEKIRREKWIEEKTKKIKEMTVKGLEPEIQTLINKHKNEIKSLKAIHDAELLQADERASQRYIRITEELRENYEREKEQSIQKERELAKQRYEKSIEEEEKSFLEQRRRLYAEIEEEKNRLAEQGALQRKELDKLKKMLEENNFNSIETIRKEYAHSQAETEKKHQTELQNLKEKLEIEKQSWEQNYLKKQESWITQKERELRENLKRERDKEIDLLVKQLEADSTSSREEVERAAENRIKRIRDKYESELKEVEKTERETMERYNNLKAKYNELEGEHERLKVVLKQKEKDFEGIKKLTDTLQEERNRLADVIRQDFSDRIIFTEEESKRIKMEMTELKSRHQYELDKKKEEIERIQRDKADELNTVHEKIKQVIAKKDETLAQLKQQYEAACKRADHLEGLLEQQRTLMLNKKPLN